jgi:hypothetical protein
VTDWAIVYVFGEMRGPDADQATIDAIGKAAERYDTQARFTAGNGEFIGTTLSDADAGDGEQRDDARRAFEAEIRRSDAAGEFQDRDIERIWQDIRDRWSSLSAKVKAFHCKREWDESEHSRDDDGGFTDASSLRKIWTQADQVISDAKL